ncbi:MAG: type II toxin-antitoxin system RelE/ParE family toxin [Gemmatimonadaceae bacterium]|nr:type II toxin-antitoxin system RelE/ParE family toxin [Gemmatimonadaceae bacterium]
MTLFLLTFIQTTIYASAAKRLLDDEQQREIELLICADPKGGELEAGVRKIRIPMSGRGKRGGGRVVYYYIKRKGRVYLLDVFPKNQRASLTRAEKNEVRKLTQLLEDEP